MFNASFNPYETLIELELNQMQLSQNQEEIAKQLKLNARTLQRLTEQMSDLVSVLHTQQTLTYSLTSRITALETLKVSK